MESSILTQVTITFTEDQKTQLDKLIEVLFPLGMFFKKGECPEGGQPYGDNITINFLDTHVEILANGI